MAITVWFVLISDVGVELCHDSEYNYNYDQEASEKEKFTGLNKKTNYKHIQ